ncbi:MAG: glycine zipper 2TM domain-containing protein [Pseudomonadota bacterium]
MKILLSVITVACLGTSLSVQANEYDDDNGQAQYSATQGDAEEQRFYDSAKVLRATPRIERLVTPEEKCYTQTERVEPVRRNNSSNGVGGAVIGGIAGALLGNQVGGGNGRTAATAAGAIGGAIVGNNLSNNRSNNDEYDEPSSRQVRRCETVNREEQRVTGYNVTYQYQGKSFSTIMPRKPNGNIRVEVSVTPVN